MFFCKKDLKVTYCWRFLFSVSSHAAQACVTGLNCVTNIPLKVIIQLGQGGFQQIMVAGRRTSRVHVSAGRVLQRITCLMSHICHWWGLKFKTVIHFGFIELYIKDTMWLKHLDGLKPSKDYNSWECEWMVCVCASCNGLVTCPGSLPASSCLIYRNYGSCLM